MKINYIKIWRETGDAFATPYEERTEWQRQITRNGLCYAFKQILLRDYDLSRKEVGRLSYISICNLGHSMGLKGQWCSYSEDNRYIRSDFACLMAELGNEGYEELIKAVTP